jgi:hypothetical protein
MATSADQASQESLGSALQNCRNVGLGLLWAAVLLGLLTAWLTIRYWEMELSFLVTVAAALAVACLVVGIWHLLPFHPPPSGQPLEALARKRSRGGLVVLILGALVLLLGIWLVFQQGLLAFPEASGAVVLGLIGVVAGLAQVLGKPGLEPAADRVLRGLVGAQQALKMALLIGGLVFVGLGGWVLWEYGVREAFPQGTGAVLLGLTLLGAGLWLAAMTPQAITPATMRALILTVGGVCGLIIAVMAAIRLWAWWDVIFSGGLQSLQGEGAWRLWLPIYVELLGLAIMFGSLLLARAEVRTNAVMRRLLYGYNAILTGLLTLGILVVLNFVVYVTYPYTFDWSKSRGLHSLSPTTKNLLDNLKEPATVYVLMSQNSFIYNDIRTLLDNARAYSDNLRVQYLSPDQDRGRYRELATKYPELLHERGPMDEEGGRGLLVLYGPDETPKTPHAFIPARNLVGEGKREDPRSRRSSVAFKGEDVVMTELKFLQDRQSKPKIYFTQGNGELDISDAQVMANAAQPGMVIVNPSGAGKLVERLKKDNYEVRGLRWTPAPKGAKPDDLIVSARKKLDEQPQVPEDAKVVVIAGTETPWNKDALDAIDRYMQRQGKLVVLLNIAVARQGDDVVFAKTGLEDLLKKYGVKIQNDYLLRFPRSRGDNPTIVIAQPPPRGTNPIVVGFQKEAFLLDLARTVRPEFGGTFQADKLLEVRPERQDFWIETDLLPLATSPFAYAVNLQRTGRLEEKLSNEAVPVGVTVTDRDQKPRAVVIGDTSFASNASIARRGIPYYDFFTSALEWLAERPSNIGIRPKEFSSYALSTASVNFNRMIFLPLGLLLLLTIGLGVGVWIVRRR